MTDSLADSLRVISPYVEPQLISPEALSHISEIAGLLPAIPIVSEAGFECRLGVAAPRADFLLSFKTSNSGREILAGRGSIATLPEVVFTNPVWNTIRNFCAHWAEPASPLYKNVTDVWLEFDVDGSPPAVPEPSFFFGPKDLQSVNSDALLPEVPDRNYQWVTEVALKALLDSSLPSQFKRNLLVCFNLLPKGAQVFQIGVMLSRQVESSVVRLCVRDIPKEQILEYLINIGWAGSGSELNSTITTLSRFVDTIRLNFAVGNTILSKIGFECYFERKPVHEPRLKLFLDYLVARQLCTPDKRDALLAWPGYSHEKSNQELWPSDLARTSSFLDSRKFSTFIRLLHHIKIVYQPNSPLEAKAYLWFGHNWISSHSQSTGKLVQKSA